MKAVAKIRSRPKRTDQSAESTQKTSLTDAATKFLRDHILDLTLAPGERIDEKSILEKFPLSRTPVREALNRLSAEGLVEFRSNHGAYVASMSLRHTMDLLTAYVLSENMIAAVCNMEDSSLADDLRAIQDRYERVASKKTSSQLRR